MDLKEKVKNLPDNPGVYIMLGEHGEILYVGKAKSLIKRVKHYFLKSVNDIKTLSLVSKIKDFRYIVVPSEIDALVLENNLIKQHKPPYNILLKDDKTYPYIKVSIKEKFPRVEVTRVLRADGSKYFGPYMVGISSAAIMSLLHYVFPLRSCRNDISARHKDSRECLDYHLGRCLAPCTGRCSEAEYKDMIRAIIDFLSGDDSKVKETLQSKMTEAADRQEFELAKIYRDELKTLENIVRKQVTALAKDDNIDVFVRRGDEFLSVVSVLNIRAGKTVGVDNFAEYDTVELDDITQFIMQYYSRNPVLAREILVAKATEFDTELATILSDKAGRRVHILCPKQGVRRQLVDIAAANADEYIEKNAAQIARHKEMTQGAVQELYRELKLSRPPYRMECYDISNISGTNKVSSMVVFQNGVKAAEQYRKFKIKTVEGSDDFMSMRETLTRRIAKLNDDSRDPSFNTRPDLIVIDGGKGQLSAVADIIPDDIDLISLAKRDEEVYRSVDPTTPVVLSLNSMGLKLLQRLRDEAHRFAITFHRAIRDKKMLDSQLTTIPGIGEGLAKRLITQFRSVEAVALASVEDLHEKGRLPMPAARAVYDFYHKD